MQAESAAYFIACESLQGVLAVLLDQILQNAFLCLVRISCVNQYWRVTTRWTEHMACFQRVDEELVHLERVSGQSLQQG